MTTFAVALSHRVVLAATQAVGARFGVSSLDRLKVGSSAAVLKGGLVTITTRLGLSTLLTYTFKPGVSVKERMRLGSSIFANVTYHLLVRERGLRIRGILSTGIAVKLSARFALHDTTRATPKLRLVEKMAVAQQQLVTMHYQLVMAQAMKLGVVARLGIGATMREAMRLTASLDRLYVAVAAVTERAVMVDVEHHILQAIVITKDTVRLRQSDIERMILSGNLGEALRFTIGIYDPERDVTTWAINARTGAVTEYSNYDFNSFAKMRHGGYVAASHLGLYELNGDSDAGTPIIADMISGIMEMTGSNYTSLRAAYIAVRGGGEFFLKLIAQGDDKTVTYRVLTKPMKTARVDVGKGWRARFFQFQLVSTGQDFDLQGVEFLPVSSIRRI